jgi:transketolase
MTMTDIHTGLTQLDELCIQTIRFLAMDAVEKAKSGHPGMPMGMAPAAYILWTKYLKFNPANPKWHARDRFVLSAGHGSMLLYSLLYLTGFKDMTLDEIKNFRQFGSRTPGHPEYGHTEGVEVTTGPLGQGISNSVGMAIAQKYLAAYFNREGLPVMDYKIYTIASDGDLEEGVSSEACSLAGHLKLNNLIVIYDDNHISIDGDTALAFTEDRAKRYQAYGWHVQVIGGDGNDMAAFEKALKRAQKVKDKPCFIQLRTHIGYGSPHKQDTGEAHGSPLGEDEVRLIKTNYGWDPDQHFVVPQQVLDHMRQALDKGAKAEKKWQKMFAKYAQTYPELAKEFQDAAEGKLPVNIDELLPTFDPAKPLATRKASGKTLDAVMPRMPLVLGGSADLTPSNDTKFEQAVNFAPGAYNGRYIHYGVREHGMGAILNGINVSGLLRAYSGTFFVFSDYMRPSIRLAALSKYPTIFVFTHDSIGLGEDGPTHQPIEHLASLRAMPGLTLIRPADANETAQAWKYILTHKQGPAALVLTRQNLPVLDQSKYGPAKNLEKGAYVLIAAENPAVLLLSSGSEVQLAVKAQAKLAQQQINAQVVSMPSFDLFRRQDKAYRDSVLPPAVRARVAVEAGVRQGWEEWLGEKGEFVGMHSFGASAPYAVCFEKFGITADAVVEAAKKALNHANRA